MVVAPVLRGTSRHITKHARVRDPGRGADVCARTVPTRVARAGADVAHAIGTACSAAATGRPVEVADVTLLACSAREPGVTRTIVWAGANALRIAPILGGAVGNVAKVCGPIHEHDAARRSGNIRGTGVGIVGRTGAQTASATAAILALRTRIAVRIVKVTGGTYRTIGTRKTGLAGTVVRRPASALAAAPGTGRAVWDVAIQCGVVRNIGGCANLGSRVKPPGNAIAVTRTARSVARCRTSGRAVQATSRVVVIARVASRAVDAGVLRGA